MAKEFKLPNLGEGVDSGDVVGVSVKAGDAVSKGQSMFEVETNKAVMDVAAPENGTVTALNVKVGDKVKPGQVVASYEPGANLVMTYDTKATTPPNPIATSARTEPERAGTRPAPTLTSVPKPAPVAAPVSSGTPAPAAPSVRKFARELGVDLHQIAGSGKGGRISEEDVKNHVKRVLSGASVGAGLVPAQPALPDFSKWGSIEKFPLKGVRKATAEGMARNWALVAHVTQFDQADISGTEAARKKFQDTRKGQPGKITMTILAMKAVTRALAEFPNFASSIDMSKGEIVQKAYRNIGIAVDSPAGLMVPVIKDTDKKSLHELAVELEGLAEKVRSRKISMDEMQGGVFTITNLGGIGGTFFTPIVNWPEVAILGISRARQELQMVDGQIESRLVLGLSLSYDHRAIDGADGARFLKRVCEILSNPFELMN